MTDPLPSWSDGAAKTAILDFVAGVTAEGGPAYVAPAERIAAFDNDGTLWCEKPLYVQADFIFRKWTAMVGGQHYLCPSYVSFFRHVSPVMDRMRDLLRLDRAPAEVMAAYAVADAHRGRNDPCTCGSGRKWKVCHGRAVSA